MITVAYAKSDIEVTSFDDDVSANANENANANARRAEEEEEADNGDDAAEEEAEEEADNGDDAASAADDNPNPNDDDDASADYGVDDANTFSHLVSFFDYVGATQYVLSLILSTTAFSTGVLLLAIAYISLRDYVVANCRSQGLNSEENKDSDYFANNRLQHSNVGVNHGMAYDMHDVNFLDTFQSDGTAKFQGRHIKSPLQASTNVVSL
ncbi:hypothetical protein ScalyP_jg2653 [Parmales sp. scaly parma]|nr:hypothetical protein ScalyP_jg2653 [Parmales sp. scaly parma]